MCNKFKKTTGKLGIVNDFILKCQLVGFQIHKKSEETLMGINSEDSKSDDNSESDDDDEEKDKEDEGGSPAITNFTVTQNNGELLFAYSSNIDINYYEISYNESNGGTVNGGDGYRFTTSQPASEIKSIQGLNVYTNWSYLFFIRGIGTNNTTMTWLRPKTITSDWITLPSHIYIKC